MKKIIILLIVLIVGAGALYYFKYKPGPNQVISGNVQGDKFLPDPRSGTFTFDNQTVTLSGGKAEQTDPETGEVEDTLLLDEKGYGDLNGDGKQDAVVLLSQSGSGSGVFIYAAAYVSGPLNYKGTNAVFLGDRVAPESVSISNGVVTVKYLDRGPDEPYAADPTIPSSKQFVYNNGGLVAK